MKNLYQIYDGFIPEATCDEIVKWSQGFPSEGATINSSQDAPEASMRISNVRWADTYNCHISPIVLYTAMLANKEWKLDVDPEVVALQFTEYFGEQKSHYSWHDDVLLDKARHRKISICVQLSDPEDYEGGQFEFESWLPIDADKFKKKGSILVFPSYLKHRVTPVTSGTRYSMVSWIEGAQWK